MHSDVLTASPSSDSEKMSLVEELKSRGRVSVTSQRYPDAKELYGKAIEVLSSLDGTPTAPKRDLAILHSNRALCYLQMNKAQESYDDATSATCFDPTYVKGFWRLGQACMALKHTQEAINAYKCAIDLDGNNKALKKELTKAEKQLIKDKEEEERKKQEQEEKKEDAASASASSSLPPPKKSSLANNKTSKSSSSKEAVKDKGDGEFTQSDHVRGYKIVNGKKTSFFHHEQTEEEKRLIGDITPKRLDVDATQAAAAATAASTAPSDVSAWNKAGTWEEKDVTDWAIQSVKDELMKASYNLPEGSPDPNALVKVVDVSKLISSKKAGGSAHASVAKVRGKKRYIFELTVCVHWEMTLGSGVKCQGKMTFFDVDGSHEMGEGYDMSDYTVEASSDFPPDARHLLDRFVRDGGLRSEIEKKLDGWITLFRETY